MKYRLFLSLAILFLLRSEVSFCQEEGRKTYIGVKGGYNGGLVNYFHQFIRYEIDQDLQFGYQGGVVLMNYLRNHIGIQTELNFIQKGYVQKFDTGSDYESTFNYVEVPFLFNVHTGKKDFHVFFNGGCFFEYLLNVQSEGGPADSTDLDFFPYEENRDPDFGYGFRGGIGAFYDLSFGTLMLEASFTYSLSNHLDPEGFDTGIPTVSSHMVTSITVGYLISFGAL